MPAPYVPAEFVGVPQATLQSWLVEAQTTLQQLELGNNPNSVSYSQGAGGKSVAFSAADAAMLRMRIQRISMALGLITRRRPLRWGF